MPVQEIKNPAPPAESAPSRKPAFAEVSEVAPIIRIKQYEGRGPRKERKPSGGRQPSPAAANEKALKRLIAQANERLEQLGVSLHLVLIAEEEGYLLEIFDCTGQHLCRVIEDLEVRPADLTAFLIRLQRAAGLVIDTFS